MGVSERIENERDKGKDSFPSDHLHYCVVESDGEVVVRPVAKLFKIRLEGFPAPQGSFRVHFDECP